MTAPSCLGEVRDRLQPIGLGELEARAPLLERHDSKYLVPTDAVLALLDDVRADYQVLQIDGARDFGYESTYFDTTDLALYRAHAQGRRLRWKARTRRYDDGPLCFREVKLKHLRGATIKLRERCPAYEHGWAGPELTGFVDRSLREHYGPDFHGPDFHGADLQGLHLTARLTVRYRRTTLVSVDGVERVTLDQELDVLDPAGRTTGRLRPGLALIEVKTPRGGRSRLDALLTGRGLRPVSLSKYGVGVAMTHPEAGRSGLRRVLQAGFCGPDGRAA